MSVKANAKIHRNRQGFRWFLSKFRRDNSGSTLIEFAFVFPIFLAFIFGIIEFSYILWGMSSMNSAASYASRYAYMNRTASNSVIANAASSKVSSSLPPITFNVVNNGSSFTINGSMTYSFYYLPMSPITVTTSIKQDIPTKF